jgi:hypothetical protein
MGHMGQSAGSRRLVPIAKPSPSLNVSGSYDTAIDNVATLTCPMVVLAGSARVDFIKF